MSRSRMGVPKIREHKGYAVCDYYDPGLGRRRMVTLGRAGSPDVAVAFRRLLADIEACRYEPPAAGPTVADVCGRFLRHAAVYYLTPDGKPTSEVSAFKTALLIVAEQCVGVPAAEFGPKWLARCRDEMVRAGWTRSWVNRQVGRVRQAWRWAAENELVPAEKWTALAAVRGLGKGRSAAPEGEGVGLPDPRAVARRSGTCPRRSRRCADSNG